MFKFVLGVTAGLAVAPAVRPYLVRQLDQFAHMIEQRANDARDRNSYRGH